MAVETFEVEEVHTESVECSEEAMRLIEELGLDGQRQLLGTGKSPTQTRFPYRKMTADEVFVYRQLCPAETDLRRYRDEPIPVRVLQVAAHANGQFAKLVVWHRDTPAVKDPVLVGMKQHPDNSWQHEPYILARWGDALDEWPAMVKAAMAAWRKRFRSKMAENIAAAQATLATLEDAELPFAIKNVSPPDFNAF